jgi:hypothetical protein
MENLDYLKGLIKRLDAAARDIKKAETPQGVSDLERTVHPVLKELQMATPRVWDDFVKLCRDQRKNIMEGK